MEQKKGKGFVTSPQETTPDATSGLGTEARFNVPTAQPKGKGGVSSPTETSPDQTSGLGTEAKFGKSKK